LGDPLGGGEACCSAVAAEATNENTERHAVSNPLTPELSCGISNGVAQAGQISRVASCIMVADNERRHRGQANLR
jgi:hypothetical protein